MAMALSGSSATAAPMSAMRRIEPVHLLEQRAAGEQQRQRRRAGNCRISLKISSASCVLAHALEHGRAVARDVECQLADGAARGRVSSLMADCVSPLASAMREMASCAGSRYGPSLHPREQLQRLVEALLFHRDLRQVEAALVGELAFLRRRPPNPSQAVFRSSVSKLTSAAQAAHLRIRAVAPFRCRRSRPAPRPGGRRPRAAARIRARDRATGRASTCRAMCASAASVSPRASSARPISALASSLNPPVSPVGRSGAASAWPCARTRSPGRSPGSAAPRSPSASRRAGGFGRVGRDPASAPGSPPRRCPPRRARQPAAGSPPSVRSAAGPERPLRPPPSRPATSLRRTSSRGDVEVGGGVVRRELRPAPRGAQGVGVEAVVEGELGGVLAHLGVVAALGRIEVLLRGRGLHAALRGDLRHDQVIAGAGHVVRVAAAARPVAAQPASRPLPSAPQINGTVVPLFIYEDNSAAFGPYAEKHPPQTRTPRRPVRRAQRAAVGPDRHRRAEPLPRAVEGVRPAAAAGEAPRRLAAGAGGPARPPSDMQKDADPQLRALGQEEAKAVAARLEDLERSASGSS